MNIKIIFSVLFSLILFQSTFAAITVTDDSGNVITLAKPATRIISLAPNITELLFDVCAGDHIVGTSRFSDYPKAASKIPLIGDAASIDIEKIVLLKPDLIIAWANGNNPRQLMLLQSLHIPIYLHAPVHLTQLAHTLENFSVLAGTSVCGKKAAFKARMQLAELSKKYQRQTPVSYFYQLWPRPLMTIGGQNYIAEALNLCHAQNIFANQSQNNFVVNAETVMLKKPQFILINKQDQQAANIWQDWLQANIVKSSQLLPVDTIPLERFSLRLLGATALVCEKLT